MRSTCTVAMLALLLLTRLGCCRKLGRDLRWRTLCADWAWPWSPVWRSPPARPNGRQWAQRPAWLREPLWPVLLVRWWAGPWARSRPLRATATTETVGAGCGVAGADRGGAAAWVAEQSPACR